MHQQLEELLGAIVFGPNTETLDGIAYTTIKLRSAARLLEYRYADMRREITEANRTAGGPQLAEEPDTGQHGQQLAPAKRKRAHRKTRGTGTTNGAAPHGGEQQPPLLGDPPANFDQAMEP